MGFRTGKHGKVYFTNKKTGDQYPIIKAGQIIRNDLSDPKTERYLYKQTGKHKNCLTPDDGFKKLIKKPDGSYEIERIETVCGGASPAFETFIKNRYGNIAQKEFGIYQGHGKEHSSDSKKGEPIEHAWVRLADGSIVDGARGQFIKDNLIKKLSQKDRVKVIPPYSPEQGAYKPSKSVEEIFNYSYKKPHM